MFGTFGTGKHNFGYSPDPPEPPSDKWFEDHCPRCKHNREWVEDGQFFAECMEGGCTGFEERDCPGEYEEGFCESCDCAEACLAIWKNNQGMTVLDLVICIFVIGLLVFWTIVLTTYGSRPVSEMPIWLYWMMSD